MNKLRLIQCGVGGHGGSWVNGTTTKSDDFDLVAVVDVSADNIAASQAAHGLPKDKCFDSLEAAVAAVEADAVLTVTPPTVHPQHARTAFAHGLHLITEKPLADTVENAREMVALAKAAGKQLVVSQNYRFSQVIETLKATIQDKPVGDFGHGDIDFYIGADFMGSFREKMPHVLLVDMAVHHLDLVRALTGRDIAKVTANSFRTKTSWFEGQSALKMMLELSDGTPFTYSGDWCGVGRCTGWNGNWRFQCSEGSVHLDKDVVSVVRSGRWGSDEKAEEIELLSPTLTGSQRTLHLFAEAIRSGKPAEISGEDNIKTFAAVMAAVKSAEEGRTVEVSEVLGG